MAFEPFRLSEAIGAGQNLASNQMRLSEGIRQNQARSSLTDALQVGTPEAMGQYRKEFPVEASQFDATQAQSNLQKMQIIGSRADFMGRLAYGVNDETTYQRALQQANDAGIDVSQAPPNYDPAFIKQFADQAMTIKQRVDSSIKQSEFELKRKDLEEKMRHNKAIEGIQKNKATKESGPKTSDYNSVNASTATLFGGVYDPMSGRISGLDKETSKRAVALSARAQKLLTQGTVKEPAAAVEIAAKEMGITLPGQAQPSGSVPDMSQREKGKVYQTPKGPMTWTGTGWQPAN